MQLHEIQREHKNKSKKIVGRGGKRGKTSGRGHKGQKQHGGHGIRPEIRDMIKKLPKLRGYKFNSIQVKPTPVNLSDLEANFKDGETVSPKILVEKKMINKKNERRGSVKILGTGAISKKLKIEDCKVSKTATKSIEKAGGSILVK